MEPGGLQPPAAPGRASGTFPLGVPSGEERNLIPEPPSRCSLLNM